MATIREGRKSVLLIVDVQVDGSSVGVKAAGTWYSGSIGKYASGRNSARFALGIGSSLAEKAVSFVVRSAAIVVA